METINLIGIASPYITSLYPVAATCSIVLYAQHTCFTKTVFSNTSIMLYPNCIMKTWVITELTVQGKFMKRQRHHMGKKLQESERANLICMKHTSVFVSNENDQGFWSTITLSRLTFHNVFYTVVKCPFFVRLRVLTVLSHHQVHKIYICYCIFLHHKMFFAKNL
jgi:hypothetical protein